MHRKEIILPLHSTSNCSLNYKLQRDINRAAWTPRLNKKYKNIAKWNQKYFCLGPASFFGSKLLKFKYTIFLYMLS